MLLVASRSRGAVWHALAHTRLLRTVTGSRRGGGDDGGRWATGAIHLVRVRHNVQPRAPPTLSSGARTSVLAKRALPSDRSPLLIDA